MTRLGLVLATAAADDLAYALGLVEAARRRHVAVRVFAMHAGVTSLSAAVTAWLIDLGCDVAVCATSAERAGVDVDRLGASLGSQDDHAALCGWADRVVAFS